MKWLDKIPIFRRKPVIKIQFRYFWCGFNWETYFGFLKKYYDIRISDNPHFIIYSNHRGKYHAPFYKDMPEIKTKAVRIFYTNENVRPDMEKCDYALSFALDEDIKSDRHFRLPFYSLRMLRFGIPFESLLKDNFDPYSTLQKKHKFCSFIYTSQEENRIKFLQMLSQYKKVDSAGRLLNNVGFNFGKPLGASDPKEKIDIVRPYKFAVAFELSEGVGYTTEKIVEAMLSHTVPIYWGNPKICCDFNPKSFISFYDCENSLEKLKERVIECDKNEELYLSYVKQPYLYDNKLTKYLSEEYIVGIFRKIFKV